MIRLMLFCIISAVASLSCSNPSDDHITEGSLFASQPKDLSPFGVIYRVNVDLSVASGAEDTTTLGIITKTAEGIQDRLAHANISTTLWRDSLSAFCLGVRKEAFNGKDSSEFAAVIQSLISRTGRFTVQWKNRENLPWVLGDRIFGGRIASIEEKDVRIDGKEVASLTLRFEGNSKARLRHETGRFSPNDSLALLMDDYLFSVIPVSSRLNELSFLIDSKSPDGFITYCCLKSGQLYRPVNVHAFSDQVVEATVVNTTPDVLITLDQLQLLTRSLANHCSYCWGFYREQLQKPADPYETDVQKKTRLIEGAEKLVNCLNELYSTARTWSFRLRVAPTAVTYDANTQTAQVKLPELEIPHTMNYSGTRYPHMAYAMQPLWQHMYYSGAVPRHGLQGMIRVNVPLSKAKELDIVNSRGLVEIAVSFTSTRLPRGVVDYDKPLDFPCLWLHSAIWINRDTLYAYTPGRSTSSQSATVSIEPIVLVSSPVSTVPYAFGLLVPQEQYEIHNRLMRELGLNLTSMNSASSFLRDAPRGVLQIKGLLEEATVTVDGVSYGNRGTIGPLVAGKHNMIIRSRYCMPRIAQIIVLANDTCRFEYTPFRFAGTWVLMYHGTVWERDRESFAIKETGDQLTVTFRGKSYPIEVGRNDSFWQSLRKSSFEYRDGSETKIVQKDNCVGFSLTFEGGMYKTWEHRVFFLTEDGEHLIVWRGGSPVNRLGETEVGNEGIAKAIFSPDQELGLLVRELSD